MNLAIPESSKGGRGAAVALGVAAGLLVGTLSFAVYGVGSAWSVWTRPADARAQIDIAAASGLVIAAGARGEAEASTLRRVMGALRSENVALRAGSFKAAADGRLVSMSFDIDGSPDAVWRTIHALETGSPAMVLTHIRATARDQGAMLAVSADALAAWALSEPAKAQSAPAVLVAPRPPSPAAEAPR